MDKLFKEYTENGLEGIKPNCQLKDYIRKIDINNYIIEGEGSKNVNFGCKKLCLGLEQQELKNSSQNIANNSSTYYQNKNLLDYKNEKNCFVDRQMKREDYKKLDSVEDYFHILEKKFKITDNESELSDNVSNSIDGMNIQIRNNFINQEKIKI